MTTIVADPTLEQWLSMLKDVTEIHDAQGNVLGTFSPRLTAEEYALYEKAKQHFDPAEMERILREQRGQGIPLADFWKELEARERGNLGNEASNQ
jgi:hypothetical protein